MLGFLKNAFKPKGTSMSDAEFSLFGMTGNTGISGQLQNPIGKPKKTFASRINNLLADIKTPTIKTDNTVKVDNNLMMLILGGVALLAVFLFSKRK